MSILCNFHLLNSNNEVNELFDDILICWDADWKEGFSQFYCALLNQLNPWHKKKAYNGFVRCFLLVCFIWSVKILWLSANQIMRFISTSFRDVLEYQSVGRRAQIILTNPFLWQINYIDSLAHRSNLLPSSTSSQTNFSWCLMSIHGAYAPSAH